MGEIKKPDEVEPEVLKELDEKLNLIADFIFTKSQENIVANGSSDTGFLLRSGQVIKTFLEKRIQYIAPHEPFIEYGTHPHPVGANKLVGWVRRKLGLADKEAMSVAYAIANKIRVEGTDPQSFLRNARDIAIQKYL